MEIFFSAKIRDYLKIFTGESQAQVSGSELPTRRGIMLNAELLPELIAAFQRAEKAAAGGESYEVQKI
jgi:hypothetical protein